MAKTFKIYSPLDSAFSWNLAVASGAAATIAKGTPTKLSSNKAAIMADAEGTTSEIFTGMAKNISTDTAAANGVVDLWMPLAGLVYSGSPKVADAADTLAEIQALQGKRVIFDLTSGDWTIDSAAADGIGNSVVITGGDRNEDILYFVVTHTVFNYFENN